MSSNLVTTSPGLIAVALVIRSRDGPRFVFHHPPQPTTKAPQRATRYGTELDESEIEEKNPDDEGDSDSDLEDGGYQLHQGFGKLDLSEKASSTGKAREVDPVDGDEHYDLPNGEHFVPWEHLAEFSTKDLESILTPSRAFHKKRFELSLDPLHFVTYPIHVREDGLWRKKKPKKGKKSKQGDTEPGDSDKKVDKGKAKADDNASEDDEDHGGMTMFNVVFVLNVPRDEEDQRIAEIYEHVVKTFNKALKHAQAQSNYVWKESEMILSMKEKAREDRRPMSWLWSHILVKSTLAGAIRDVFDSISKNKIATVHIPTNPSLDLSLQIPVPSFLTSLPSATERAMPGLPVTTANPFIDEEGNEDATHLNKHFALLLLQDEDKVIAELQSDNTELSEPLIECIRLSKPSLSFLQVAQTNSLELPSLLVLAQHLLYWRKAIAIPPLHGRDTYIVSPNCDSHQLPTASMAWKRAFPLAPSLPNFLANISAQPRPYKTFAPSKDHRATYLDMLGWLIRGGWVTQLRTFAWILVWPEIIYEVKYQLKADALRKKKDGIRSENTSTENPDSTEESGSDKVKESDADTPLTTEQVAQNARLKRLADRAAEATKAEADEFANMTVPVPTDHPSFNKAPHLKSIAPYIIVDPHKVGHEESLYIAALGKRFTDPKVKECWFKFCKYFNGSQALEMIALREGMKRKETWGILMHFQEHIVVTKHW
ncbi:Nitrogen permease regulator 3 [Hyphodiscus hymeniophilus]|uniref:Nitrogen permease regulator 3 n=1 Tax=Hyphodiscus hymeniophilus TaxID=353542 RepID=A0A9P6VLV5_9HELO|nr:Nitrogen permease regulator 3 [Hyphodiscus hymeniophilus]